MKYKIFILLLNIVLAISDTSYSELGSKYDVEILRDTWGVPHIYGVTDIDVAFGFAYAHSEDDFKTIQDVILQTRGKLSSIYGKKMAPVDYMTNLLRVRENVEKDYEKLISDDVKNIIRGYVDGLNYYAFLHPDEAIKSIFPIKEHDIVSGFVFRTQFLFGLDYYFDFLFNSKNDKSIPELPKTIWRDTAPLGSNSFADKLGMLYQITDDLIDYKGETKIAGKPTRRDKNKGKQTLINFMGYNKTLIFVNNLKKKITINIKKYGIKSEDLLQSVEFILKRKF